MGLKLSRGKAPHVGDIDGAEIFCGVMVPYVQGTRLPLGTSSKHFQLTSETSCSDLLPVVFGRFLDLACPGRCWSNAAFGDESPRVRHRSQ